MMNERDRDRARYPREAEPKLESVWSSVSRAIQPYMKG